MLRPFVLVLSVILLAPFAGAAPAVSADCPRGSPANVCVEATDDGAGSSDTRVRCAAADIDAWGCSGSETSRNATRPAFFDVFISARNATVPLGDPDFDLLLVCCGDLDGDGLDDAAALGARCAPASDDPSNGGEAQGCKWHVYSPLPSSLGFAYVAGGGDGQNAGVGTGSPAGGASVFVFNVGSQHGAGAFVFAGGAFAGCFASIDDSGRTAPSLMCFP